VQPAFFKIGVVVVDLDQAMRDLGAWLGVSWTSVQEAPLRLRTTSGIEDVALRFVYSTGEPPYFELLEAQPRGYYAAPNGAFLHHYGRWVDDLAKASSELAARGLPLEAAGVDAAGRSPSLFAFHAGPHAARVELVDSGNRKNFEAWLAGGELVLGGASSS